MAKFSDGTTIAGVSVAVALIVSGAFWYTSRPGPVVSDGPAELAAMPPDTPVADASKPDETVVDQTQAAPTAETKDAPQAAAIEETAPAPTQEADTAEVGTTIAPAFDEVRREADGMTILAGRAAPGAQVVVLLDGAEISSATADNNGKFAAITMIDPDGQGHVLSLNQMGVASVGQIILAPLDAPVEGALAEVAQGAEVLDAETVAQATATADGVIQETGDTSQEIAETASVPEPPAEPIGAETAALAEVVEPAPLQGVPTDTPQAAVPQPDMDPAPQEVAVLRATDEGVELLNAETPDVMDRVALDTISYSELGEVQLSGRAQADTRTVRVYLDNDAVVSLVVDDQGRWRGDLPDVDEGIYTLRVDEVASDGTVTSRVETPFKREAPEVLAAAVAGQEGPLKKVTVQKGATLWAIAEQRYGSGLLYVNVFKANADNIRDPDLIYPGQVFDLPGD